MFDIEAVFERSKKDLIEAIKKSTPDTFLEHKTLFLSYFSLIESLQTINTFQKEKKHPDDIAKGFEETYAKLTKNPSDYWVDELAQEGMSEIQPEATPSTGETSELLESIRSENEPLINKPMYLFERKILGGFVPELNAFVPEPIVERFGLEHHDFIYATEVAGSDPQKKKYIYELAKKAETPVSSGRLQYNLCPIEMDGSMIVVRRSMESGADIKINDIPQSVRISDEDAMRLRVNGFDIKEGDLVDIAFPEGKPELCRVLYVRKTAATANEQQKSSRKRFTSPSKPKSEELMEQTLEGKTVFVVGDEPNKTLYKRKIEERGGALRWADAKDDVKLLKTYAKKSDVVIYLNKVSEHTAAKHIKQICKENQIPFHTTFNLGVSTVLRLAENLPSS